MSDLFSTNTSSSTYLKNLGVAVDNDYIYHFFKFSDTQLCAWKIRRTWNNSWLGEGNTTGTTATQKFFTTYTANDTPYSASYIMLNPPNGLYRLKMNGTVGLIDDQIYNDASLSPVDVVNLSAAGNDVHVVWKDNLGNNNGNNLRYKYYDDYPVPAQNLTIYKSENNHPLLTWVDPNPDGDYYIIYRLSFCAGGWNIIGNTAELFYEDETLSFCTATPPAQCENECVYYYKIKTVDLDDKISDYSNPVAESLVGGVKPQKIGSDNPDQNSHFEYALEQNYPNPFNPTTTINYSIKSTGNVTLKVYDLLGREVAMIINEMKEAGNYSASFNANNLPSGIYFYTLNSGNFVSTKKLSVLK